VPFRLLMLSCAPNNYSLTELNLRRHATQGVDNPIAGLVFRRLVLLKRSRIDRRLASALVSVFEVPSLDSKPNKVKLKLRQ